MKNINVLFLVFTLSVFSACDEDNTLEIIDELTVEAFLHVGQSLDSVKFGKVIPLDSLEAFPAPNELLPIVTTENGESFILSFTGVDGIYGNPDLVIEEDKVYRLEIDFNGKTVSAETYTPFQPQNLLLSDTELERAKIEDFTDLQDMTIPNPIELNWEGEEGAYYFVNVKNIEDDPEVINILFEEGMGPQRPDFLTEPSINNFYTIDSFRDLTHFGKYEVTVYQVNPEYVALYEDNTSGTGSLNEIRTNVQNGFGIFTGVNSETVFFEVKKL